MEAGYIPEYTERNECTCSLKDRYKNVYSNFIHNNHKLETTKISINSRMDL